MFIAQFFGSKQHQLITGMGLVLIKGRVGPNQRQSPSYTKARRQQCRGWRMLTREKTEHLVSRGTNW